MYWPPEFDYQFYKKRYGSTDNYENTLRNFYRKGMEKGEAGSLLSFFNEFVKYINQESAGKSILEIGPGVKPRFTGNNIFYFDVHDADGALEWAARMKLDTSYAPQKIDFVSKSGSLDVVNRKFDVIFSSHNLEHVIDLVDHMNSIERLLNTDGVFCTIVPDMRFTFDYHRGPSTIYDVLGTHYEGNKTKHPMETFLEHKYQFTHNVPARHWVGDHGELPAQDSLTDELCQSYLIDPAYVDCHRWKFTQDSFQQIFSCLFKQKFINMELVRCYNVPFLGNSFNCVFVKGR